MGYTAKYNALNSYNQLSNIDAITGKMITHLLNHDSVAAETIWKVLGYNTMDALLKENLTIQQKSNLINTGGDGEDTTKRIFQKPFTDDSWNQECASLYFFIDRGKPENHLTAKLSIAVECVVHVKIAELYGDGDPDENQNANPNDTDREGNLIVQRKNRAEVLVKNIISEFNGLYLDGVGYLQFNAQSTEQSLFMSNMWNNRAFYGYSIRFGLEMSGVGNHDGESDEFYYG